MIAGLIIVPIVSLFTPKPDQSLVEDAFACYNEKVVVLQSSQLGEKEEK